MFGLGFALAHQGHFSVDNLEFTEAGGVRFLAMRVAYAEHDAPLKLSAVLVDGEAAVLEQRQGGAYQAAEHLIIDPGLHLFSATSLLRVRLPDNLSKPDGDQARTVTMLFEPGFLINTQVHSEALSRSRAWLWWLGVMLQKFLQKRTQIMRGLKNLEERDGQAKKDVERRGQRSDCVVGTAR